MRTTHFVVGACAVVVGTAAITGTPTAAAATSPQVVGKKYSDASTAISGAGLKAVVTTTVGDQKAWSDCVVTRQQDRVVQPPPNTSGSNTTEVLVSLDCDPTEASATVPGWSAGSPEGRAAAAAAKASAGS